MTITEKRQSLGGYLRGQKIWSAALAVVAVTLAACGNRDLAPPDGVNDFYIRATVDGLPWESTNGAEKLGVSYSFPGMYVIVGEGLDFNFPLSITFSLYNIGAPGTYPLGVGLQVPGGSVDLQSVVGLWSTPMSGADGSITITTLTADRIRGTFNVGVAPANAGTTTSRTITQGTFNLELKPVGNVPPLPPNAGSRVSANIGGVPFNAAAAGGNYQGESGFFAANASNNLRQLSISLGGIDGVGTYNLGPDTPELVLAVSNFAVPNQNSWSSLGFGSSATVTITSITDSRVVGTFSGVLGTAPGTQTSGTLSIANGQFDIGRP